jgi:hypothetical protein
MTSSTIYNDIWPIFTYYNRNNSRVGLYVSFLTLANARGKTSWRKGLPVIKTIYTYGFHELFLKQWIMLVQRSLYGRTLDCHRTTEDILQYRGYGRNILHCNISNIYIVLCLHINWMNNCCLTQSNQFYLYHGENTLHFDEMMSVLY